MSKHLFGYRTNARESTSTLHWTKAQLNHGCQHREQFACFIGYEERCSSQIYLIRNQLATSFNTQPADDSHFIKIDRKWVL